MISRRSLLAHGLAATTAGALWPAAGMAQGLFTDKPVRFVIPFAPGGVYDAVGRPLAEKLKVSLGSTITENVVGAGGTRGGSLVAHATPDGHTLLVAGTSEQVIAPAATSQPAYNPLVDFDPITRIGLTGLAFVVHPSVPIHTLQELVDYVRRKPGELSFGTPGAGTLHHLTGETFNILAQKGGIVHVPYAGAGPALNDLIGGHIQIAIVIVSAQVFELHRTGKLRMIVVTTPLRIAGMPEIPTVAEAGMPDLISQFFIGLFAPKGTPKEIVQRLAEATGAAMKDPELRALFDGMSFETDKVADPVAMRAFLKSEIERWTPIIKASGFKLN